MKKIWLAGGCFWGVEAYYQQLKGVQETTVGYGQGVTVAPSYEEVCSGQTGHAEICQVVYDETVLPLAKLLEHYFRIIDPTTLNYQGHDHGTQYRTGIYFTEPADKPVIAGFIGEQQKYYANPIVVETEQLKNFYPAEEYHQAYLAENPRGYCHVNLAVAKPEERK